MKEHTKITTEELYKYIKDKSYTDKRTGEYCSPTANEMVVGLRTSKFRVDKAIAELTESRCIVKSTSGGGFNKKGKRIHLKTMYKIVKSINDIQDKCERVLMLYNWKEQAIGQFDSIKEASIYLKCTKEKIYGALHRDISFKDGRKIMWVYLEEEENE